jgi:hypothetical protein
MTAFFQRNRRWYFGRENEPMKIIGKGIVHFYDPVDEGPHPTGDSPDWNESVVILVWDEKQGVYLDFRLGHEANRGNKGLIAVWNMIWVPGKMYRRYIYPEMRAQDRLPNGFGGGRDYRYTFDGKHHWQLDDGEIGCDLVMEDFCQGFGFWPASAGTLSDDIAKNHIEAPGKVNGWLRFQGKTYELKDAFAYRDHSWGVRKWETARSHFWSPAVFGPDLSLLVITWLGANKTLARYGFVKRGDELIVPKAIDAFTFVESDAITHRGGMTRMVSESGEVFECRYDALAPGSVSAHHGYPAVDTPCRVTLNNGERKGVGLIQAGFNAMGGTDLPIQSSLVRGYIENGVFPY